MKKSLIVSVVVSGMAAFSMVTAASALTISAFDSADNLAQSLVGSGVTVSNASYTGATGAAGYFTGGMAAGVGFEQGIVLTSGLAASLSGTTNTSGSTSTVNNTAGSSQLNALISQNTNDAAILSFDFVSTGDAVYFNYFFGSEEYNEFVGSFNDVFAFFFEGDNIALLPDGSPVSINNVNLADNPGLFNDNDKNGAFAFEYDGFTNVLTATATGLTAGTTYGLSLQIADAVDYSFDSGVFLEAGSFSNTTTDAVPEPGTMLLMGTGLLGLVGYTRKRSSKK